VTVQYATFSAIFNAGAYTETGEIRCTKLASSYIPLFLR